jgi:outer membrane receptor protein involved in Fe transport
MKIFYLLIVFTLINITAFAQQTFSVKGKVHKENGEVVSHVTIKLEGTNLVAMTDENGLYEFKNVPAGKYNVLISSIEIESKVLQLKVNKNYPDLHIHIDEKGGFSIDEVRIERKTVKKELETSGFAVTVIETKEAALRNLTTNELLDRAVGVRVRQNGGLGSNIEYNLNGISGSAVGIFLDGTPISVYGSSFNLNNIPPAMIERIEVYKGVLPSHLLGDYIGGAINVIMKKDASGNNISAALSYGSFNTSRADLSAYYRNPKSGFTSRLSGFYTHTDNSYEMWGKFAMLTDEYQKLKRYKRFNRFNNEYKSLGGRFEFGFTNVDWADQFFIGYNISDTYNEIPHGTTMAQPYVGRFQEFDAHVLSLTYNKRNLFVDGLSLNFNATYSNRDTYLQDTARTMYNWDGTVRQRIFNGEIVPMIKRVGEGQQGTATIQNINRKTFNTQAHLAYTIVNGHRLSLNHSMTSTKQMSEDLLKLNNVSNVADDRNLTNNFFKVNYEALTLSGKLKTNVFGKYTINQTHYVVGGQKTTITNSNPGYGATLAYNIIPKLYIQASGENTTIAPRDEQIFGAIESNILENLDLKPERNVNYNLGLRYSPLEINEHKISLYGGLFTRNGYDKIATQAVDSVMVGRESDANIETTRFINLGKTQAKGFEAEMTYNYKNKLNALINFSKFNNLFKQEFDDNGNKHFLYNRQVPNEPFFTLNANVEYRLNNLIQRRSLMTVYYNTGYVKPYSTVWIDSEDWFLTPTQFYHDLGGSYRTPSGNIIVSLDVKNFTNAEVYDNFGVQKPGRAFYLKVNYILNNRKK